MQPSALTEAVSSSYALYSKALMRHCYARTWNKMDAEEVVQDTFMNVCEYLARGNSIEDFRVFLYKVANNLLVDRARSRKRQREKEVSLDVLTEKGFEISSGDPLSRLQRKIEAKKILTAAKELKPDDYNLFVMRYIDGLPPADIAVIVGLTSNNVSVRLHRAVREIALQYNRRRVERKNRG
jgi:RNA polymerase sigma-70 factor, ECF subfamily